MRCRPDSGKRELMTAVCIDGRTIPLKLLNAAAVPFNYSLIFLFESNLFNGKSDSARQRFMLPDNIPEGTLHHFLRRQVSAVSRSRLPSRLGKKCRIFWLLS